MTFLEIGLFILLSVGLVYMISINKKLKMLKSGSDGFKAVVIELNHATENAKTAIQGLKLTVRDAEHGLDGNLKQARSVTEELKYLLNQGEVYSDGMQTNNGRNTPALSENLRNIRPPVVPQNKAKNFADQTLEKVARQKQSLPNPIMHSQNQRIEPELGRNIPSEHREMALQAREQALKSIAAKNGEQNKQHSALQRNAATRQDVSRSGLQNTGAVGQARNVPNHNQSHMSRQPSIPRKLPGRSQPSRPMQAQAGQLDQMSLSDMVGRHTELERQSFTQSAPVNPIAGGEVTDVNAPNASSLRDNANSLRDSVNKRESLFQKLSKTR
ncbi:MAG: hypothetical protein COB24_05015 [Hyphomicrobiales bacterium]|nr:MAG: hypothetical protein COB24_05015 [Hyphomicrobiales bacterium]